MTRATREAPQQTHTDVGHLGSEAQPGVLLFCIYTYANLYNLNKFRKARGLNNVTIRPHAGEAGDTCTDHLASAFMLCENISHGINLRNSFEVVGAAVPVLSETRTSSSLSPF